MVDDDTLADVIDVLGLRADMLERLALVPHSKSDLQEKVDVSRSTVDRGIRRLETLGLVEHTDEGYQATTTARILLSEYDVFTTRIGNVVDAQGLVDALPMAAPLDPVLFERAEVVMGTPPAPHEPGTRVYELIEGADRLWGLAKANATPGSAELLRDEVDRGMALDLVVDEAMFEHLTERYRWFERAIEDGTIQVAVREEVPYGLFLVERGDAVTVCLLVYDETGNLHGIVVNDTKRAIDWARSVVDAYEDKATRAER